MSDRTWTSQKGGGGGRRAWWDALWALPLPSALAAKRVPRGRAPSTWSQPSLGPGTSPRPGSFTQTGSTESKYWFVVK